MKLERHPLSAAWPDMAREDFDALVMSIEKNGLREPIVLFDGAILDGWHRYQACESSARPIATTVFEGDAAAAEQFVCDKHTRRHLTATQRAAAVLAMMTWRQGAGRPKNNSVSDTELLKTTKDVAARAGVSVATVDKVKTAIAKAPERAQDMRDGKVSAVTVLRETSPKPEKKEAPDQKDWKAEYDTLFEQFQVAQTLLEAFESLDTHGAEKAIQIEIQKRKTVEAQRAEAQAALNAQNKTVRYWKARAEKAEAALGRRTEPAEAEY